MQEKLNKLIGKDVKLCGKLSGGSNIELFSGKLNKSHLVQEKFIVGDFNNGPTFSFVINQLLDVVDSNVIIKFCLKV